MMNPRLTTTIRGASIAFALSSFFVQTVFALSQAQAQSPVTVGNVVDSSGPETTPNPAKMQFVVKVNPAIQPNSAITIDSAAVAKLGTSVEGRAAIAAMGGTNTGGSDRASEWGRSAQGTLEDAKTSADIAIVRGDWMGARQALIDGFNDALTQRQDSSNSISSQQSLTFRILVRGLDLVSAIGDVTQNDPTTIEVQVRALEKYYLFAEASSRELDVQAYAKSQLTWLLDNFTETVIFGGGSQEVHAKISNKAYLKMAELITSDVVADLNDPLSKDRYLCVTGPLNNMNQRLARSNAGDPSVYGNDRYAINLTYSQLRKAVVEIQNGCRN